jgi:hypothetical protein
MSKDGAKDVQKLRQVSGCQEVRAIAGTAGCITHPDALQVLHDAGIILRLGTSATGIFHPKMMIGGEAFSGHDVVRPNCGYVGSANLTHSGLHKNIELGLATDELRQVRQLAATFSSLWVTARPYTDQLAKLYAKEFARIQRSRAVPDIEFFETGSSTTGRGRRQGTSDVHAINATVAWAGLESFTGEHAFQVEFPRQAGKAMSNILGATRDRVDILCADGKTRKMVFRYYDANGMYRLNVPNDVPLVEWARLKHSGILCVRSEQSNSAPTVRAEILRDQDAKDVVLRSKLLSGYGRTSTREYGWY